MPKREESDLANLSWNFVIGGTVTVKMELLIRRIAAVLVCVQACDGAVIADMRKWFAGQYLRACARLNLEQAAVCSSAVGLVDKINSGKSVYRDLDIKQIRAALAESSISAYTAMENKKFRKRYRRESYKN